MTAIQEKTPTETTPNNAPKHTRRNFIAAGAAAALLVTGGVWASRKDGRHTTNIPSVGSTDTRGGGGAGEVMPRNPREDVLLITENAPLRKTVAMTLGMGESAITASAAHFSNTTSSFSFFSRGLEMELRIGLGARYQANPNGPGRVDTLEDFRTTALSMPDVFTPVSIPGAEAAYLDKTRGWLDVFGSTQQDVAFSVALVDRTPGVPPGEHTPTTPNPDALFYTTAIAKLIMQEHFAK